MSAVRRVDKRHVVIEIDDPAGYWTVARSDAEWERLQREVRELAQRVFGAEHQVHTSDETAMVCADCGEPWEGAIDEDGTPYCCYDALAEWTCAALGLEPRPDEEVKA